MLRKRDTAQSLSGLLVMLALLGPSADKLMASPCPEGDIIAVQWLDKMARSAREVSYQGVVTLQQGQDMKVLQVSHSVAGGSSWELLTELNGIGAQVQRRGHPLDCAHPGLELLRAPSSVDSCGIAEQYRFSIVEGERVAGRDAITIKIAPRDMYRFGYVLSLDEETGLLLKALTVHPAQRALEIMQFAQLSFNAPVLGSPDADVTHEATHPPRPQEPAALPRAWTVIWTPGGFKATETSIGTSPRKTYTDGLAAFSVFLESLERDMPPGEGHVKQGSTITYTRGMHLTGSPVLVTVIGEVPLATARMVADSVRWVR